MEHLPLVSETFTSQITRDDIKQVVAEFYRRARMHPDLGPVFAAHVEHWATHEQKIGNFWCSALLRKRVYSGNPMQKHLAAGNVHAAHFAVWLALFDEVLMLMLSESKAQHWSELAHRIGKSLSYGLTYAANKAANAPPPL